MLFLFPRRSWANFWAAGVVLPLILCALYTVIFGVYWFQEPRGNAYGFFSLTGLHSIFQNQGLLLAGFIDLTAIPLFLGAWMTRKAAQIGVPYILLLPSLLLTAGFPATGFVFFAIVVAIRRGWHQIQQVESQTPSGVNGRFGSR